MSFPYASCPEGSSGHSAATHQAPLSNFQESLAESEEDVVWGILVPLKANKLVTVFLTNNETKFGRSPLNNFMFDKKRHRISNKEFTLLSKEHFTIKRDDTEVKITDHSMNGTYSNGVRVHGTIPLQHNSIISVGSPKLKYFLFLNKSKVAQCQQDIPRAIQLQYTLEDVVLGRGKFGVVKRAFRNDNFNDKVAIKMIREAEQKDVGYEYDIFKDIVHPSIVRVFECFKTESNCFIIMEYMEGGDLHRHIKNSGPIAPSIAREWFEQIAKGVAFLHGMGIIHRDLKPENILISRCADVDTVKIADFGLSRYLEQGSVMNSVVGTCLYWAPEVTATEGYGKEVDLWSLGCLLYVMLLGQAPFPVGQTVTPEVIRNFFSSENIRSLSHDVQQLFTEMLEISPKRRIDISGVLNHTWVTGCATQPKKRLKK